MNPSVSELCQRKLSLATIAGLVLLLTCAGCSTVYREGLKTYTHPEGAGQIALSVIGLPLWLASWPIIDPVGVLVEMGEEQEKVEEYQREQEAKAYANMPHPEEPCPVCNGTRQCRRCDGAARRTCTYCKGAAGSQCTACAGTGKEVVRSADGASMLTFCSTCRGTGEHKCVICNGSGSVPCPPCDGTGKCDACHGTGRWIN